jgi:hypothetical protein
MTIEWNPHAKEIEGLEHLPAGLAHVPSNNYQDQWALTFKARHTGGITDIQVYLPAFATAASNGSVFNSLNSPIIAELHNEGDEDTGEPTQDVFTCTNVPGFSAGIMTDFSGGTPDAGDVVTLGDGLGVAGFTPDAYLDVQFDTAAYSLSRRVIRSGLEVWCNATYRVIRADAGNGLWAAVIPVTIEGLNNAWAFYHGEGIVKGNSPSAWSWQTPQHIRDFRSGGPNFYRVIAVTIPGFGWHADLIRMHVVSVPENRIGVGVATYNKVSPGQWVNIPMKSPAGTGNPSVTSGNKYTLIIRRTGGDSHYTSVQSAQSPHRYLRGLPLDPADYQLKPVITSVPAAASAPGFEASYWLNGTLKVDGLGDQVEGVTAARFVSGGVCQPESQPYELQEAAPVFGIHDIPTSNAPSTGFVCTQTIAITGTGELYGQVMAVVGWNPNDPTPDADLSFELRNSSNTIIASGASISPEEWLALPGNLSSDTDSIGVKYKRIRASFPSAVAPGAGVYKLVAKSPACHESGRWSVGVLSGSSDTSVLLAKNQSMGGHGTSAEMVEAGARVTLYSANGDPSLYTVWATGSGATSFADAQMVLSTVPPKPANVTAEPVLVDAHHVSLETCANPDDPQCAEETVSGITISWDSVSATGVTSYQIERQDDGAGMGDFTLVAVLGTSETSWTDFESAIGTLVCYRVRAFRDGDGVPGLWSDTVCTVIPDGRVALSFTSNWATGMAVTYPEAWETDGSIERAFEFAEYGDIERRLFYGRDGQPTFHPVERRGVVFSRILLLNALVTVAQPTLDLAKPLRDLSWVQIPYVCVRDGDGNRWFASITVPNILNKRRGERWFAEVGIAEAVTAATVVDTREPQVVGL